MYVSIINKLPSSEAIADTDVRHHWHKMQLNNLMTSCIDISVTFSTSSFIIEGLSHSEHAAVSHAAKTNTDMLHIPNNNIKINIKIIIKHEDYYYYWYAAHS